MARGDETRLCAVDRLERPTDELIRFVLGPDGAIVPDTEARAEGRGVWVTASAGKVAEAARKKVFARSLKAAVTVPDDLVGLTRLRLTQRFTGALGMARKAGQFVTGATRVRAAIGKGEVIALVFATDAAPDGRSKMLGALRASGDEGEIPHLQVLASDQLGLALGLENVIHAALTNGAAARSALQKGLRLARYDAQTVQDRDDREAVVPKGLPQTR